VLEAATKAILYAALLPTVGASAALLFLAPALASASARPGDSRAPADRRSAEWIEESLRRVGLIAAACVIVALVLRVWAQADAAFGLADSLSPGFHHVLTSRWGARWHWQLLAAVACAIAYACAGGGRRAAWLAAAAGSVALCLSLTLTGHAAGDPTRMVIHAAHLVGAGLWLGTLATLVIVSPSVDAKTRAALFHAFSPLALAGAGIAAAAGATAAIMYVGAFENLWLTSYGRTLIVKLALVAGAAACGYANWRRVGSGQAPARATVELWFAAAIIIVTAVLTELEHP
jgi:putative copper export protein